jgi:hypothetical protein
VTPSSGGPDTIVTLIGTGFDPNPLNNCVATTRGTGVRVLSASPTQIQGRLRAVATVGSSVIAMVTGTGASLADHPFNDGLRSSTSTDVTTFMGNNEGGGGAFNQTVATPPGSLVAGAFAFGNLTWTLGGVWVNGSMLEVDIHLRGASGWMDSKFKVTFGPGFGTAADCANHVASHISATGLFTVSTSGGMITVGKSGGASAGFGHWRLF